MQNFGIYVHIPFCQKKCKYCDFVSFDKCGENVKERYVQAVIKEIENCKIDKKVSTIYFGGRDSVDFASRIYPANIGKDKTEI